MVVIIHFVSYGHRRVIRIYYVVAHNKNYLKPFCKKCTREFKAPFLIKDKKCITKILATNMDILGMRILFIKVFFQQM